MADSPGSWPVTRARALVGTRFRLHGRANAPGASGVDCIGLVAHAHGLDVPTGYAIRGDAVDRLERVLVSLGFVAGAVARPGDLLVLRPGPVQLHLGLWAGDGLIHADALLRRVVETPGVPRWPLLSRWTR